MIASPSSPCPPAAACASSGTSTRPRTAAQAFTLHWLKPALVGAETCLVSAMVRLHGECYGGAHCGHALWAAAGGGAAVVGVGGKRDAAGRGGKDRPADGEEGGW